MQALYQLPPKPRFLALGLPLSRQINIIQTANGQYKKNYIRITKILRIRPGGFNILYILQSSNLHRRRRLLGKNCRKLNKIFRFPQQVRFGSFFFGQILVLLLVFLLSVCAATYVPIYIEYVNIYGYIYIYKNVYICI